MYAAKFLSHQRLKSVVFVQKEAKKIAAISNVLLTHPIGGQHNELMLLSDASIGHIRLRNQTKILETKVTKSSCHCQTRGVIIRKPKASHLWFILESKDPALTLPDSLCFPC